MWRKVDDLVVKTLISAEPALANAMSASFPAAARGEPITQCFQLFGFDVMPDADAKPWLIEVNCDPQMTTDSPLDLKVKSAMLTDALNVAGITLPPMPT
eukprot:6749183-Prymnesium_polylepis.1